MRKFKVGDRIVRVTNPKSFAPIGYESVVKEPYEYIDRDGALTPVVDNYWGLAEDTSKYHKHHDLIIQWAKGAEIEYGDYQGDWENAATPTWSVYREYRIKPIPPKTDKERIAELEDRVKELEDNQ